MSEQEPEKQQDGDSVGIPDENLPADLVPGEDNPLAEGLPDGESAGALLEEGKQAEQTVYAPGEGVGEVVEQRMTGSDDHDDAGGDAGGDPEGTEQERAERGRGEDA